MPHAEKYVVIGGQYFGVARQTWPGGFFIRKDLLDAKGVKPPKVYDPDVVEMAKKCQDPAQDLWGFGQTLNRSDDGNGFMQNILWNYGGSTWDKDGKPALGTTYLKQNLAALQFAVDTIQKYKIQPPGVMGWTDVHNNEAFMAGKLVSTNNGASLYYAMVSKKHPLAEKTQVILTPGGPAGSFLRGGLLQLGDLQAEQERRALRGPDPLGRGREALRRVHEGLDRAGRPRLQAARREPLLEERPQHPGDAPERPARRVAGLSRADHAGGHRGAGAVHPVRHGRSRGVGGALARGGPQGSPQEGGGHLQDPQSRASGAAAHGYPGRTAPHRRRSRAAHARAQAHGTCWGPTTAWAFSSWRPWWCWSWPSWPTPSCYAVYLSLTQKFVGMPPVFVGFENYIRLASDGFFQRAVANSFVFTFWSVAVKLVLGMVMALVLMSKIRFRSLFTGLLLIPWVAPTVVSALNFLWIYDGSLGVLNYLLVKVFRILPQGVGWLSEAGTAMASVIFVNVWRGFPFFGISLLAGMKAHLRPISTRRRPWTAPTPSIASAT